MKNRSQAALEFLMTYGWAILVVLLVIAVLMYSGVINTDAFLPDKCALASGIVCRDYAVEGSRVILSLKNNIGIGIIINSVDVLKKNGGSCSNVGTVRLNPGEATLITVVGCDNGEDGEKFVGQIDVSYTKENLLISHVLSGTISSTITGGSTITSENICQNAQNSSLCEGLDIVFGEGYQASCCIEYALCCG